jgi:serine/threonine protein kinase
MPLSPGTSLGPYRIGSLLGAGGMGEVYQAKDTRLGRDVAIKILPASFAEDPDRRARFEREAQAIAALSHPNVVAIFDTGIHERQAYVVMELLTGETLRERLAGSSRHSGTPTEGMPSASLRSTPSSGLALRKAVDIAIQIARGLGAAHAKGIIRTSARCFPAKPLSANCLGWTLRVPATFRPTVSTSPSAI